MIRKASIKIGDRRSGKDRRKNKKLRKQIDQALKK